MNEIEFICFVGDPHKVKECPYVLDLEKANREIISLRAQLERESEPEPLTLEQLLEMENVPLWVIPNKDESLWCVWDGSEAAIPGCDHWWYDLEDYGKTWIAYPRKPLIAGAPSADVSPNLYGEWTTQGGGDYYCSNCYYEIEERKRTEYCPSCGTNIQIK